MKNSPPLMKRSTKANFGKAVGRRRFGEPPAGTEDVLNEIDDLDCMGRLTDAAFTAASWEELLAVR